MHQIHIPGRDVGPANRWIDRIEGATTLAVPPSSVWRDVVTGVDYASIAGGLAWPAHPAPGALVVLGLRWAPGDRRTYHALAEVVHDNLFELVSRYLRFSDTWALDAPGRWFGAYEPEPIYSLASRCCRDAGRLLLITDRAFEQDNRWPTYCQRIFDAVGPSETLFTGDMPGIMAEGTRFTIMWRGGTLPDPAQFPLMAALGRALEGLDMVQPPRDLVTVPGQAYGDPWNDAMGREYVPPADAVIPTIPNFDIFVEA